MTVYHKSQKLGALFCRACLLLIIAAKAIANQVSTPSSEHHPHYTVYQQLEKFIPIYTAAVKDPWPTIETNQPLKLGVKNSAVIALRKRLQRTRDLPESADIKNPYFDKNLEKAVRVFQERHGILVDGVVGNDTLIALNISPQKRLQQIHTNIKRWKEFSKQIVPRYIWINVPDYRLRFVAEHQTVLTSRVIVGKPTRATPELDSDVTHVILNPYWNVPPTIARHDLIPKALANPQYLQQQQIRVFSVDNPKIQLSWDKIQWPTVARTPHAYLFRQDPGPKNALGQIKFQFTNPHSVYLHDTPSKELFSKGKRLFSSGCVRLENPLTLFTKIAERDKVIQNQIPLIQDILQSGRTVSFKLAHPVLIRVTYITAWVDESGVLHFWDDIYKRDHHLIIEAKNEHNDLPQPL